LVCTYTNVAVDNLVEGFAATGVKALRVAFGGKVKPSLYEHTLDYKIDHHPLKPEIDKLAEQEQAYENNLKALQKKIFDLDSSGRHQYRLDRMKSDMILKERQHNFVRSKKYQLRQKMLCDIFSAADVVCSECFSSYLLYTYLTPCRFALHVSLQQLMH
jgi:hypothetical protein